MNRLIKKIQEDAHKLPIFAALDLSDQSNYWDCIKALKDDVFGIKINPAFTNEQNARFITSNILIDGKFGDVPHTMEAYSNKYFKKPSNICSVTLNPYCGEEALLKFTEKENGFSFIWTYSSDAKSRDCQTRCIEYLLSYKSLINKENVGFVVPGNDINILKNMRKLFPDKYFLIPGIGKQGGDISDIIKNIGIDNNLFVIGRSLIEGDITENIKEIKNVFRRSKTIIN